MKPNTACERVMKSIAQFGKENAGTLSITGSAFAESVQKSIAYFAGEDEYAVIQRNKDSLSEIRSTESRATDFHASDNLALWNDAIKKNRFMAINDNDGYLVDKKYRSWMLIPVFVKKEIVIAIIIARKKGRFHDDEISAGERIGEYLTQSLRDIRHRNKRVSAIAEDARHGMLLHTQEMLGRKTLEWNGLAQVADYGARTGSDFAKAWRTQDDGLLALTCDITASDIERQAGLLYLDAWFSLLSRTTLDARSMLERLNSEMLRRESECYAAIALIRIDKKMGKAEIAGCGNTCIVHFDHDAMDARYFEFGPVAGICAEGEIRSYSVPVKSGDILCAYTDGIGGAKKRNGDLFGHDAVCEIVKKNYFLSSADLAAKVFSVLGEKEEKEINSDDRTLQTIKIE
jgi:hypothetical protein